MTNFIYDEKHLISLILVSLLIGGLSFVTSVLFSVTGKNNLENFMNETGLRRDRIKLLILSYIAISAVADSFYFKYGNYLIGFGALVTLIYSSWMVGAKSGLGKHVLHDLTSEGSKKHMKKEKLLLEIEDCNGYGLEKRARKYGLHTEGQSHQEIRKQLKDKIQETVKK